MPQTTVAANVRAELARRNIRQTELAERLGITRQNVSSRLNGRVDFRVGELMIIAELLNVPVTVFLDDVQATA